jgi:hypothetical protein
MALFNKYFEQNRKVNLRDDPILREEITEYINAVNHIKEKAFDLEECGACFSTYRDEFSETSGENYERSLLLEYEPRIISQIILGY